MASITFSVRDWSDEYGRVEFPLADQGGTETIADIDTNLLSEFRTAVEGVSLGQIAREAVRILEGGDDSRPTSSLAQREFGLRVFYETNVSGEKRNLTVPCVDIAALDVAGGSDLVNLEDAGPMAALVTAIEDHLEVAGESVTVTRAQIVGRNS